jgi:hypothetical protein
MTRQEAKMYEVVKTKMQNQNLCASVLRCLVKRLFSLAPVAQRALIAKPVRSPAPPLPIAALGLGSPPSPRGFLALKQPVERFADAAVPTGRQPAQPLRVLGFISRVPSKGRPSIAIPFRALFSIAHCHQC